MRSDPLPETGLENVVEVDTDSTNLTLVDLELMQVRLRVNEALGTSPVVLPEIRAQPVLQRPINGLGVAIQPGAGMAAGEQTSVDTPANAPDERPTSDGTEADK